MHISYSWVSCGVFELHRLFNGNFHDILCEKQELDTWDDEDWEEEAWETHHFLCGGYTYIFSDVDGHQGDYLYNEIKRLGLGEVKKSGPYTNPNSGNKICIYVWHYNGKRPTKQELANAA